jgi:glyoxylase-like metal-dependent hydrolase (beta-lactamase superfamily II)
VSGALDRYKVTIVKYGTRTTTRSDVYLNYPLYHEPDAPMEMDYFFWVLQNGEHTVVVDTGFSPEGGRARNRTLLAPIPDLFQEFGVDPATSPTVVLTHAHYDHAGNLGLFPTSSIVMARSEFAFWGGKHARRAMFHHSVDDEGLDTIRAINAEGRLELFDEKIDVAPGIQVVEVGGHTPGQSVVKVETHEGTVLLASDAVHYYEECERDMLFMSVANLVQMYDALDYIRGLVEANEVRHVVAGHDPCTLSRFDPVAGEYGHLAATIGRLDG